MGIKSAEHALERAVDQFLVGEIPAIDIIIAHLFQHGGEEFQLRIGIVLLRALHGRKIDLGANENIGPEQGEQRAIEDASFHIDTTSIEGTVIWEGQNGKSVQSLQV